MRTIPNQRDQSQTHGGMLPYFAIAVAAVALLLSFTTLIMLISVFDVRREAIELNAQTEREIQTLKTQPASKAVTVDRSLTRDELAKITGRGGFTDDGKSFQCVLHNENSFAVTQIKVRITDKGSKLSRSYLISNDYPAGVVAVVGRSYELPAYHDSKFICTIDLPFDTTHVDWSVESADIYTDKAKHTPSKEP